jgi:3-carboxy-cis,cis-muconate cycloisomerase
MAGLACALAIVAGALGKIARDIALLMQAEVGEAAEPQDEGRGGSSAMAHKHNPVACQVALSAALRAPGLAATLLAALPQELERGLGGWQAEAPVLAELFALVQGAAAALCPALEALDVRGDAMARNLAASAIGSDTGEAEAMVAQALAYDRNKS